MRTWRAFRTMLLTALRNPGWAILSILLSPVRAGKYVIGVALFAFAIGFVLMAVAGGQATRLGFPPGTAIHTLFVTAAVVLVTKSGRSADRPRHQDWQAAAL
jgi:type IV secretion system protein VirD4